MKKMSRKLKYEYSNGTATAYSSRVFARISLLRCFYPVITLLSLRANLTYRIICYSELKLMKNRDPSSCTGDDTSEGSGNIMVLVNLLQLLIGRTFIAVKLFTLIKLFLVSI